MKQMTVGELCTRIGCCEACGAECSGTYCPSCNQSAMVLDERFASCRADQARSREAMRFRTRASWLRRLLNCTVAVTVVFGLACIEYSFGICAWHWLRRVVH